MNDVFDASGLHSESDLWLRGGSVFTRGLNLYSARIDGSVQFTGARFDGKLNAGQVRIGGSLSMNSEGENKASFNDVILIDAKIGGQVNMLGASFNGPLYADRLKVGGNLFAPSMGQHKTRFQRVSLLGAEITGYLSLIGDNFDGDLSAGLMQINGSLFMNSAGENKASFKRVELTNTKVVGHADLSGASFDDVLEASLLQVGGYLSLASKPPNMPTIFRKDVNLNGAKITGRFDVDGASFEGKVNADSLKVGGDLFMRYVCHADKAIMAFANIGGNLDLRNATLADADFSGASVAGELRLGGLKFPHCRRGSGTPPDVLNLRNAKVGNLMVASDALTTPQRLRLDGFSFGHLGGSGGQAGLEMRARGMEWWDNWVRLDPHYSPILYEQLAAAFTNLGDRNAANEIRYLGLERKRKAACEQHAWTACLILTTQWFVTGYGIGLRVLYSMIFLTLVSAAILWGTVPAAKQHGFIWCFGASLSQLLPVIQLNKEFTEFFYDPERTRLKGWQIFLFSSLGVIGLALGATLIIAVSGLTQVP